LTAAGSGSRYFISYSHRSPEDSVLADNLRTGLESAGHEVFIDRGMRAGTDWVAEIERRIDCCDALVVLLSEASIHSEMVLGEVRRAHRKRRKDGRPQILPIRVHYDGPLDYELDSYIARIQYIQWQDGTDTSRVLGEIRAAGTCAPEGVRPSPVEPATAAIDPRRPQPSEDVRPLLPGGTMKLSDEFYVRRRSDEVVEAAAKRTGETIAIKAPRQFGKSSLLVRYLAKCGKKDGRTGEQWKRFTLIDFQNFTDAELDDYPTLLTRIAEQLLRSFRLKGFAIPRIDTQAELSNFIEDEVLPQVAPPLTLAFDEVDRVLGRRHQSDFFSMLRLWHNRRAEPSSPWEQVDLALVIATEPYLLIASGDRSPFNVATWIELKPFDRSTLDDLNARYGDAFSSSELDVLHELLAGHPFLTRLAFYRIAGGEAASFHDLETRAAEPYGPFGDHLRAMLMLLQHKEGLVKGMRQLIAQGSLPDDDSYFRLHGAGLVERDNGRLRPANLLYTRFFRSLA
jgi:hypothetical protein